MTYQILQQKIEQCYDITIPCNIDNFVCHDKALMSEIAGTPLNESETLLVQQCGDNLDLTLYLEERLQNSTFSYSAEKEWSELEFTDFCTVIEGVSHFVYVVWNAGFGKNVKPVELELQAEVDKFVFAASIGRLQKEQQLDRLINRLFKKVHIVAKPGTPLHARYRMAHNLASDYCTWLMHQFDFISFNRELDAELARFYRMNAGAKFDHIRQK